MSLFAKPAVRADLWALYAFNHEIAKTREVVTETQLGLIRLQWWRDAVNGLYAGNPPPKHEVLEPLAAAIKRHNLPKEHFDNLLYAREFDLEDKLPATLDGMVNYADYTSTPLLKLALQIEGRTAPEDDIKHAATSYALTGLIRAVIAHARQRRCYLPENMLRQAGIDFYELYEGKGFEKLAPVLKTIAAAAKTSSPLLPAKMAAIYLKQIEGAGYNLLSSALTVPPPFLALRLWIKTIF